MTVPPYGSRGAAKGATAPGERRRRPKWPSIASWAIAITSPAPAGGGSRNTLAKSPVTLGERDARLGNVVIVSGIVAGDRVLRTPGSTLASGQRFELAKPVAPAASVAPGA